MASTYTEVGGGGGSTITWAADLAGSSDSSQTVDALSKGSAIPVTTRLTFGSNPATTGGIGIGNNVAAIFGRNAANSANLAMIGGVDTSNILWIGTTIAGGSRPDISFIDAATDVRLGVNGASKIIAGSTLQFNYATAATATAGVGSLPATPEAFWPVTILGTAYMVPLYKP